MIPQFRTKDWMKSAACAATDPELFFPKRGQPGAGAKLICAGCPVLAECRDWSLARDDLDQGIFAGLSPRQREAIRRDQRQAVAA